MNHTNLFPLTGGALVLALTAAPIEPAVAQQASPTDQAPAAAALRLDGRGGEVAIQLDGKLAERWWTEAEPITGFRQLEPAEGEPATERTEIRVLYDHANLYVGVRAFDSEPDRIIARQLERDSPLGLSRFGPSGGDDAIELILDTFHDGRNAYYFATNPRGVLVDGLVTDEARSADTNWDGVWDVRTRLTEDGWTAEFAIPLRTLRFPETSREQVWGFNAQRVIGRKNEQSLWTSWSRDNEGLFRISRAGDLRGLRSLERGADLAVKPYALGEAGQDFSLNPGGAMELDGELGLDAKLGFPSGLVLDLTVNTDFAQVEADDEQIDLTRFTLFFPEKREFFLENAGIFEFGAAGFGVPDFLLFFSRRIGLQQISFAEAQPVPIIGGARLTGRVGGQTIGFMNVVTAADDEVGAPLTNYSVGRLKRDIGERSYVGAIATHRLEEGGFENLAGGVDLNLWLSSRMALAGFYARTAQTGAGGDDQAWRLSLDFTGDWIGWFATHMEIGPETRPGIGFVRRLDMAQSSLFLRFTPRPPLPGLRKIDIFGTFDHVTSVEGRDLRDRIWGLRVSPSLDSGDEMTLSLDRRFQRLQNGFELTPGVVVPPGDYEDWAFAFELQSSQNRSFSAAARAGAEGFWNGDLWTAGGSVGFSSPHVGVELGYDHNDIEVPNGAFTTDLLRARLRLALNTRLFGNALIQWNSQTNSFSTNLRLDFIHRPGSDLFVVFNERRDVADGRWDPRSRAFVVKLTYLRWF